MPKAGAKVMSLQEPLKKMSKSDPNPKGYISMLDESSVIAKKIKSAVTDSEGVVEFRDGDESKAGINNLMTIYSAVTGKTMEEITAEYAGKGYGAFKGDVADAVVEHIRPIREEYDRLSGDKAYLEGIFRNGAEKAEKIASRMVSKVYKKVGFLPF